MDEVFFEISVFSHVRDFNLHPNYPLFLCIGKCFYKDGEGLVNGLNGGPETQIIARSETLFIYSRSYKFLFNESPHFGVAFIKAPLSLSFPFSELIVLAHRSEGPSPNH